MSDNKSIFLLHTVHHISNQKIYVTSVEVLRQKHSMQGRAVGRTAVNRNLKKEFTVVQRQKIKYICERQWKRLYTVN
jgi:hypothetical protein